MLQIGWLGWQNWHRDWLETGFLALLPATEQRPDIAAAIDRHNFAINRKLLWLVGADNSQQAIVLAEQLENQLVASGLFAKLQLRIPQQQYQQAYQHLFAYRYQLLNEQTRKTLNDDQQQLVKDNLTQLYGPLGQIQAASLEHDPWLLFGRFLADQNPLPVNIEQGVIVVHEGSRNWVMLLGELTDQDLKLDKLEALLMLIANVRSNLESQGGELLATGVPLFTAYGSHSAQQEISTIGTGSTLGVVILLWLTFRSPRPLFLCCLAVACGLGAAWVLSLEFFNKLHIITLVFGSSLIGVVIDYALHFFCDGLGLSHWTPRQSLTYVLPGISFGLLTSLLGYAGLGWSPFPGLREIAVFSAIGLIVSWLTVVMLFPILLTGFQPKPQFVMLKLSGYWQRYWPLWLLRRRYWLGSALLILVGGGLWQLTARDDIRLLQSAPVELLAADAKIRQLLPFAHDNQFFVVSGENQAKWYQNEQRLVSELEQLKSRKVVNRFEAISQYWPDSNRQQDNYDLLQATLYKPENLQPYMSGLGFNGQAIAAEAEQFKDAEQRILNLGDWLNNADESKQQLWLGCNDQGCRSIVNLSGIGEVRSLSALRNLSGVEWVDHVGQLSDLFQRYRQRVTILLVVVCGLILAALLRKLGWRIGLQVMAVPVVAMLTALSVLGWCRELFTLFNLFALLLVLEVAIDYAVFFQMAAAANDSNDKRNTTTLAVSLSAFTTLMAYGLLATSETAIVHAFGVTLASGIFTAFLLAPLIGQ